MRRALVLVVLLAACGDNSATGGDDTIDGPCEPPATTLPTTGKYIDPTAIALPDNCVASGLRDLPGRWFVADQSQMFRFEYPKYAGSCTTGFSRVGKAEDHDSTDDGHTFYTWSDGTRYFQREAYEFQNTTYIYVRAACLLPDGTITETYINYDTDRGERTYQATGTRYEPKDGLSTGLTLLGELAKVGDHQLMGLNLVIDGQRAYFAGETGLDIIDVSNPAAPQAVGFYDGSWNDVRVVNDGTHVVAFLSPFGSEDPTQVVDVTNPASPQLVTMLQEYSHSLFIQQRNNVKELYLATYNESVPKYDVTNPLVPVRQGMAIVPGQVSGVHDLFVDGDKIYANNTEAGLVAFDTSGGFGTSNVELGRFRVGYSHASWAGTVNGHKIVLAGDEGMTATPTGGAHLSILDGDPTSQTFMKELAVYRTRPEAGIHNFEVHDNLAYIAYYNDGVRIVDLSDPTQPREVAHYNTWQEETAYGASFEGAVGIRKVNGLIYVADLERGLMILRED